jgi:hypothetical protein
MGRGFSPLHVYPPTSPPRWTWGACGGIVAMGVAAHAAHVGVGAKGAPREGCGRLHSASGGSKDMTAGVSLAWPLKAFPLTSGLSALSVARSASRGVDVAVAGCAVRPRGCAAAPCGAGVARGGLEAARMCRSGHAVDGRSASDPQGGRARRASPRSMPATGVPSVDKQQAAPPAAVHHAGNCARVTRALDTAASSAHAAGHCTATPAPGRRQPQNHDRAGTCNAEFASGPVARQHTGKRQLPNHIAGPRINQNSRASIGDSPLTTRQIQAAEMCMEWHAMKKQQQRGRWPQAARRAASSTMR